MSRIGRKPIPVPSGVEVTLNGTHVTVKGPKGTLERDLVPDIPVTQEGDKIIVTRPIGRAPAPRPARPDPDAGQQHGGRRVRRVHQGPRDRGVGYRATAQGPNKIELALGFSHPVHVDAPEGITFEVPSPTRISVRGTNKEMVGQVAANIRKIRKPEPYKGKGVRYAGERILRKAGKAGKK